MTLSNDWNQIIQMMPASHVLQSAEWAQVKSQFGWQPTQVIWYEDQGQFTYKRYLSHDRTKFKEPVAAATILSRALPILKSPGRFSILYIPKGPIIKDWGNRTLRIKVLEDLKDIANQSSALFLKIDPDIRLGTGIPGEERAEECDEGQAVISDLKLLGWQFSDEQIQFRNTVLVDLTQPEKEMLARMKQKTRYNVRLAARRGVRIRVGTQADLETLYQMYAETSLRDDFVIREKQYYLEVWRRFMDAGEAKPLIAEVGDEPVAAVIIFNFGKKAWYLYGMSRDIHRDKMPNYLLQWEAMRQAKTTGCEQYDLWGAPDDFVESDPLWNVYRFKKGLGGEVVRHIGAWDLPLKPYLFWAYKQVLPGLLSIMRRTGKTRTMQDLS